MANYVRDGVDHLLLLRVSAYHEVDYQELLHFHLQSQSSLTQVYAADGSLDIALVSAATLRNADSCLAGVRGLIPRQRQFLYHGYLNRLRNLRDLHRLVQDGLRGNSRLSPVGTEVRPGIWLADGARIDVSAKLNAPVFVGANSRVAACCDIANATSIERGCEIDCGTTVNQSWVLPNTYVGMSLNVRRSVVSATRLFHVDRNVAIAFEDGNLVGPRKPSSGFLTKIESFLRSESGAAH